MGDHRVHDTSDEERTRAFVRALLDDIRALEILIERDQIEGDIQRVGVEQEMYIVDRQGYPAGMSDRVLEKLGDERFTTELARFNLEANLEAMPIGGDFLRRMENGLLEVLGLAEQAANAVDCGIVLTGILPTLQDEHVTLENLTPEIRYRRLNDSCMSARGNRFSLHMDGVDRFESSHDCTVVEGANTSLQIHLQVSAEEAGNLYNLAQLISAPLLAAAANSPILLDRRVWHETRVALFERVFEYRSKMEQLRHVPTRVGFGDAWVRDSILEVFRDNAMRHHVIMLRESLEDPFKALDEGRVPELSALTLHNGTIWRWNRPCYGITNGRPHLRIENRALPAGPTVIDEVANAAFFYGLMHGYRTEAGTIPQRVPFEEARVNFLGAAQHGLDARFTWLDNERLNARELLLNTLIPAAREGLESLQVPAGDIDRYLGLFEERVSSGRTGASWLLDSAANVSLDQRAAVYRAAVQIMREKQGGPEAVHRWALATPAEERAEMNRVKTLADVMSTNLFTVRPEDLVDLAGSMMEWKHIRHVPVESSDGELVGLLSALELLRLRSGEPGARDSAIPVSAVMQQHPLSLSPHTPLAEACRQLLGSDCGCILVVENDRLLGIVSERDLLGATAGLLDDAPLPGALN